MVDIMIITLKSHATIISNGNNMMDVTPSISCTSCSTIYPHTIGTWTIDDPVISGHGSRSTMCSLVYAAAVTGIFEVLDPTIFH